MLYQPIYRKRHYLFCAVTVQLHTFIYVDRYLHICSAHRQYKNTRLIFQQYLLI